MKEYGLEGSDKKEQVWGLYVGTGFYIRNKFVVKLLNIFHPKVLSDSFVIIEKKNYCLKAFPFILDTSLAFLNSFFNIFNKYNVLTLNKYNLK